MDMDRVREYIRLRREQKQREAAAAAVKEEADLLEQTLLEDFATDSVQNMSIDGTTVYLSRQLWARVQDGVDKQQVIDGLRETGLGHFVTESFNTLTLSSWVRDLEREDEELPDELKDLITTTEKFALKTRRA